MRNPQTTRRITRADVARLAGVSTAVVSYVLNNGPAPVAPATRERVENAIEVLGYRRNASARALATGSSRLLGVILPDIGNPFFSEVALSIEAAANLHGYAVLLSNSNNEPHTELDAIQNLVERGVDSLLLSSVLPVPDVTVAQRANVRTVLLNVFMPRPGYLTVGVDATAGAYAAVSHLIDHGHRSVALIIGRVNSPSLEAREEGWLRALDDAHVNPGPIIRTAFSREGGHEAAKRMFSAREHPTAVFISSDLQAVGALSALHELGLRVPEDIAVLSFDGTAESKFAIPALTTVRQPIAEMSTALVELALSTAPSDEHRSFPTELIIRESCGTNHPTDHRRRVPVAD